MTAWQSAVAACRAVATAMTEAAKLVAYQTVNSTIDLDNYIDQLICETYAHNNDWPGNNWRASRGTNPVTKWRFLIWDAEVTFRPGEQTSGLGTDVPGNLAGGVLDADQGVMQLHVGLKGYDPYKARFSDRIKKHFFYTPADPTSGALALVGVEDRSITLFQNEMSKFGQILYSESARWGYIDTATNSAPFAKYDPGYLQGKPYGDWNRNTAYTTDQWLVQRRTYYLNQMQNSWTIPTMLTDNHRQRGSLRRHGLQTLRHQRRRHGLPA